MIIDSNTILAVAAIIAALAGWLNGRKTKTDIIKDYQDIAARSAEREQRLMLMVDRLEGEIEDLKDWAERLVMQVKRISPGTQPEEFIQRIRKIRSE